MARPHAHGSPLKSGVAYLVASLIGITAIWIQAHGVYGSHSAGLAADTFHLASDLWFNAASGIALVVASKKHKPGVWPGRMLIVTGIGSVLISVWKCYNPHIADPALMFNAAATGLCLNILMLLILHLFAGGGHSHAHGHEHHDANIKHLAADTVSSLMVTLGAFVLWRSPSSAYFYYIDPLMCLVIGWWLIKEGRKKVQH